MTEPMLQLRRHGLMVGPRARLEEARAQFDGQYCVLLRGLLEAGLAQSVLAALERSAFTEYAHEGIGTELCARPGLATGALELLTNDPEFFEGVRTVTGCGPVGLFHGRIYRMVPGGGHYDSWHSDVGMDRMVAMSINLSAKPYEGGVLQIREDKTTRIVHEVANTGFGDAILFKIGPGLSHRVTTVEGSQPKTALAGWFRSRPIYRDLVRERSARSALNHGLDDRVDELEDARKRRLEAHLEDGHAGKK